MTSRTLTCNRCGHVPAPAALLAGVVAWWPGVTDRLHPMPVRTLTCYQCGNDPTPEAFLAGRTIWWPWLNTARHVCPVCGTEDVQPEPGRIVFGCLYAAARAHYAAMDEVPIAGLTVRWIADGLRVAIGSTVVDVPKGVMAEPPGRRSGRSAP